MCRLELILSVMLALISVPPFSRLPLHIRCFTEYAYAILMASPSPLGDVSVILDLGGVSGSTGRRRESTMGATSQSGPIDVSDNAFRSGHWNKWSTIRETNLCCGLCDDTLDPSVRPD
jgi:structure-specific endonuclease subunit SLX1